MRESRTMGVWPVASRIESRIVVPRSVAIDADLPRAAPPWDDVPVRAVVSIALTLAACGRLGFEAADGGDAGDSTDATDGDPADATDGDPADTSDDTTVDPDASGGCAMTGGTTFPGGFPCTDWGANRGIANVGMSESNGSLTVTPNANTAGANGACQRQGVPLGAVEVELSAVLTGAGSQTGFRIIVPGDDFVFTIADGSLVGEVGPISFTDDYDATTKRWLRIGPAGAFTNFQVSADGITWNDFGFASFALPATGAVEIFATTPTPVAAPGTARFETVRHCD